MVIPIHGPKAPTAAERKKSLEKTQTTGGPSFLSFLEQAGQPEAPAETAPLTANAPVGNALAGLLPPEENLPRTPAEQANALASGLTQAAADILSGSPTAAAEKIKAYLAAEPTAGTPLTPEQQQALDNLKTRAAITVAKLEG